MTWPAILLLAYVATPLICWTVHATLLHRRLHWFVLFVLTCIIGYVVLMISVQAVEIELQRELDQFDLDNDGSFSDSEMTAEAERAMDAWASDTGRRLAPIFGIPYTIIWTTINFLVISIVVWIVRFMKRLVRGEEPATDSDGNDLADLQNVVVAETGNPYHPPATSQDKRKRR